MDSSVAFSNKQVAHNRRRDFCFYGCCHDVVMWKNPVVTASVLVLVNVLFAIFYALQFSLLHLFSLAALGAMCVGFVASLMLETASTPNVTPVQLVTKDQIEEQLVVLYDTINRAATHIRFTVLWRDRPNSIRCCLVLGLLAYVSSLLSFTTVLFLISDLLLSFKHIYAAYLAFIHPHLNQHAHVVKEHLSSLLHKGISSKDL